MMLRPSFVPPAPIMELRDLTRARAAAVGDRTREVLRLEKMLEGSGIKLSGAVASLTGVSSRAMLDALIRGERDPLVLAQYAQRRMRSKIPELVEALTGRFSEHHAFLAQLFLAEIDTHTRTIEALTERIEGAIRPFQAAREALVTIPGVSTLVADESSPRRERTWPSSRMPVIWPPGLVYARVQMNQLVGSNRLKQCPATGI